MSLKIGPRFSGHARGIGGEGAALAAELREFQPPPLAEDYRRLNPDFWSWLDAAR